MKKVSGAWEYYSPRAIIKLITHICFAVVATTLLAGEAWADREYDEQDREEQRLREEQARLDVEQSIDGPITNLEGVVRYAATRKRASGVRYSSAEWAAWSRNCRDKLTLQKEGAELVAQLAKDGLQGMRTHDERIASVSWDWERRKEHARLKIEALALCGVEDLSIAHQGQPGTAQIWLDELIRKVEADGAQFKVDREQVACNSLLSGSSQFASMMNTLKSAALAVVPPGMEMLIQSAQAQATELRQCRDKKHGHEVHCGHFGQIAIEENWQELCSKTIILSGLQLDDLGPGFFYRYQNSHETVIRGCGRPGASASDISKHIISEKTRFKETRYGYGTDEAKPGEFCPFLVLDPPIVTEIKTTEKVNCFQTSDPPDRHNPRYSISGLRVVKTSTGKLNVVPKRIKLERGCKRRYIFRWQCKDNSCLAAVERESREYPCSPRTVCNYQMPRNGRSVLRGSTGLDDSEFPPPQCINR